MNVLIYSRSKKNSPVAEQTANLLCEQLQQLGLNVEVSHHLNIPRLILNSYQTVHFIVEELPLNVNESFHMAICKALGKSTVLSILNSDKKINRNFLDFIKPDALSVTQTNHLKLYRNITGNKFIFSAFPKTEVFAKKSTFKHEAYLIPLNNKLDEVFEFNIDDIIYFDGRSLLKKNSSAQLRKKWNELVSSRKINNKHVLILSDSKVSQLINDESLSIVLASSHFKHTEFTNWLGQTMNKNNLIVLNEYQATGFSYYWTSGHNCRVLAVTNWMNQLSDIESPATLFATNFKSAELFEPTVNELSRLYSKLWHQKTSLLTSQSAKL
ncbi:MAG: hypothetical protein ABL930_05725 [Pseudobdellovibrio sp.]